MMLSAVLKMLLMALMSSGYIPAYCEEILFFERGLQGIVPCNPDASAYSFGDLEFVVWYFSQKELEHVVFLFSQGAVVPQDGISEGQYNISSNFSLIIQNVTDSVEGTYYYKVEPKLGRIYEGSMEVSVKVTTKQPFPIVHECDPQPKAPADTCISHVPHDKVTVSLTCQVDYAKPPVNLQWFRVFDDGHTERVEATPTTKLLVHRPGAFFIDNTYTSLSSLHLSTTSDNNTTYKCEAYGIALGDRNGSHVLVTISKDAFSAHSGTTQETASSSPPKTSLIVLVVIFGLLSLFFGIILLILCIRHQRLGGNSNDSNTHLEMTSVGCSNVATVSGEGSPLLGAVSAPDEPQWEKLASELGFSSDRIADLKSVNPGKPEEQIWRMLSDWRGQGTSPTAQTKDLCATLTAFGREDLAYELQALTDQDLHKISKGVGKKWPSLAYELGLSKSEVDGIRSNSTCVIVRASDTLAKWRDQQLGEDHHEVLCGALENVDKKDLATKLRKDKNSFIEGRKRLQRVTYKLMLEPDSKKSILPEPLPPVDMVINNQEDLRSLRDVVIKASELRDKLPHVETLNARCRSQEDVDLLREIIRSTNTDISKCVELQCDLSENWKKELQSLVETIQPWIKLPQVTLTLFGNLDGHTRYDMGFVGKCLFKITSQFPGEMGLSLRNMIQSRGDIESLVDALKVCKVRLFGCSGVDLQGQVRLLAPLITDFLKELWLHECNLTDDDVSDLTGILPKDHALQRLAIHRNKLSLDGISGITSHLTSEHFPQLNRLDVYGMGLDAAQVKEVVEKNLPRLKEIETGIFKLK